VNAPETEIQAAPPSRAGSRTANFHFGSPRPNSQFQCRLDGGDFTPCSSPYAVGDLPEGTHTFEVRAFDQNGNVDGSPAVYTWVVDVTAPRPRIANVSGSAPAVQGTAGTASGDAGNVTVELFAGGSPSGSPIQSVTAPRSSSGAYTARFREVAPGGTYTVRTRQRDAAGNTGLSAPTTFAPGGPTMQQPVFGATTGVTIRAARRVASRGRVTVVVTNRNGFAVTGRLAGRTLKKLATQGTRKRIKLRAKRLNLRASGRQTVRLALPRAVRTALRRNGRIALRLSASLRDPAGNRRSVTKRATPRAKRTRG
jgi:hypothetical protein